MLGKSKFPGKPSKVVNKKRVSVLFFDQSFDESCEIDDLDALNSIDAPTTKKSTKNGFQTDTTNTTTAMEEVEGKPVIMTTITATITATKTTTTTTEMDAAAESTDNKKSENCDKHKPENSNDNKNESANKKRVTFRRTLETSDQCKVKKVYNPNFSGKLVSIIKKESLKHPILVYKSNCIVRPSRLTEIVKNSANNIDKLNSLKFGRDYQQNVFASGSSSEKSLQSATAISSANVIVASKFNLPKMSANSSRLIKPNKRFIFDTGGSAAGVDEEQSNKKKVIKSSFWGSGGESHDTSKTTSKDNKRFGFHFVDELDLKSKKKHRKEAKNEHSSSILRKPVLQLSNFGFFGALAKEKNHLKSPFSLNFDSSNLNSSTSSIFTTSLICHVCHSITTRKQPRKYGAVCCELCKKFMSKMIERVNKNPANSFQCDKGDGSCTLGLNLKGSHKGLKSQKIDLKALSKGRCYACWLKKCLLNFQLPPPLKARLTSILPVNTTDFAKTAERSIMSDNIFSNSLSSTGIKFAAFKLTSNPLAINNFTFGSKPDIKSNVDGVMKTTFGSSSLVEVESSLSLEIPKEQTTISESKKSPKLSPKTKAEPVSPTMGNSVATAILPANVATSETLRQIIPLKGPRVKHVCRSASLVLGQPIAIFPSDCESQTNDNEQVNEKLDNIENVNNVIVPVVISEVVTNEIKKPIKESTKKKETKLDIELTTIPTIQSVRKADVDISKPITRKLTRPTLSLAQAQNASNRIISKPLPSSKRMLLQKYHKNHVNHQTPMISIDFWENYDPAEVSRTGFGLILSEQTPIKSLCFLCGSCGSDPLIFCVCCCEPYHYYCFDKSYDMPLSKRLNWLCPRCTVCYTCNMSTGAKVKCQKCEKNYHTTCLGTSKRLLGADRPLICAGCLKCKSCGTTNVTKFIGNLPMCSNCFRLRQKGNFCPLCQKCYENNDYDLKMMECGDCRRWVHAKCEGLTDEQYNLLSVLPEHIEFICKKCSSNNALSSVWRESVASEFKNSLLSVIKLLSKSRHACVLLKLSPRKKNSQCSCYSSSFATLQNNFNSMFDGLKSENTFNFNTKPIIENNITKCNCNNNTQTNDLLIKPNINGIKQNINEGCYHSLQAFNYDMNKILTDAQSEDLLTAYNEIISEIFPWYQNETKACTDALEETMNDHSKGDLLDDLILHTENEDYFMVPALNIPDNIQKKEELMPRTFYNGKDTRFCMLCKKEGECLSDEEGRLLYCGHNTWVHTNCALWSAEVYEEIDGSLQNVHSAISRGRLIKCSKCGLKGATVGCNFKNCGEHYHFLCARSICEFCMDKRVFCPQHLSKFDETRHKETNFQVNRSVYVELDRKKKKTIEATKVQFLIGSLYVTKIGRIVPPLSDAGDFLVPVDFECSRLYWSAKQPWTIVEYKIRITIQRSNYHSAFFDKGVNFTVDHNKAAPQVKKNLQQISIWHQSIGNASANSDIEQTNEKRMKNILMTMLTDETNDEEPQNNNDLLPPEIKDAIFEDLPHDVLDGISMFDIFPKSMTCEDPKTTMFYNNDCRYLVDEDEDSSSKSHNANGDDNGDCDLNGFLTQFSDYTFARKNSDDKLSTDPKRRKLSTSIESNNDSNNNNNNNANTTEPSKSTDKEDHPKLSVPLKQNEIRIPIKETKIPQLDGMNDEIFQTNDGPVACERCHCTYRNRNSYDRHLGTCEIIATTNESDSESPMHNDNSIYMTNTSQQSTITGMTNSNVISMINQQQNQQLANSIPIVINPFGHQGGNGGNLQNSITLSNGMQNLQNLSLTLNSDGNLCQNVIVDQQGQQIYGQPINLGNFGQGATLMPVRSFSQATSNVINNGNISYINTSQQQQQPQYISLAPASNNGSNSTQQMMTFTSQQSSEIHHHDQKSMITSQSNKKLILPSPIKSKSKSPGMSSGTLVKQQIIMTNGKKKQDIQKQQISVMNSKNIAIANYQQNRQQQVTQQQPQNIIFQQQPQQQQQQQQQQLSQYPLILNQNGQLVQYYTSDGQNNQIQYLSGMNNGGKDVNKQQQQYNQQFLQNSFQLPNNNSGNLVLSANGISVLPVVPQSQVIGTLIQQPQGLQCGLMSAEQMMLGSTPSLEMDPTSGCMYLTSQPLYYGLETIVQNTVMSSQQFVSTAMQGVLSQNSSYSATTTQVFQASKIEPIMELPQGYVFLNAGDNMNANTNGIHQSPSIMDSWNIVDDKKIAVESINTFVPTPKATSNIAIMKQQKTKTTTKVNKIQPQIVSKIIPASTVATTIPTTIYNTVLKTINENPVKSVHQNYQIMTPSPVAKKQKNTYRTIGPKITGITPVTPEVVVVKAQTESGFIKPKIQSKPIQTNNIIVPSNNTNYHAIPIKPAVTITTLPKAEIDPAKVAIDQSFRNVQSNNMISVKTQKVVEHPSTSQASTIINIPTNVVNPMQQPPPQQNSIFNNLTTKHSTTIKNHFQNRPTNRVLPMQVIGANGAVKNAKNSNKNTTNGACGNTLINPTLNTSTTPVASILTTNINSVSNQIVSQQHQQQQNELLQETYSEKIKSIAMELQSSKSDDLFDSLRRQNIATPILGIDKNGKKSPTCAMDNYLVPSTSASSISSSKSPSMIKTTSSSASLTKTIDSVATGANLLEHDDDDDVIEPMKVEIQEINEPLHPITITLPTDNNEVQLMEVTEKIENDEKLITIETMYEELPELKPPLIATETETDANAVEVNENADEIKESEKINFVPFDEEMSAAEDKPSTSAGPSFTIKSPNKPSANVNSKKICGPKILYEIQSQDGFTYKSTSISEIWEKLFETVQCARKAHGLMPLPEGRLNEMTGDQMLGLKTNALKYLLEQLPGVEKCTRYSPKYHQRNSSASSSSSYMNEADDILYENIYGTARFEPYTSRSEYDMFSWLASRHRLAPLPVHLQSNNDDVILRRGTGSNLPMAMKYRTLKESYKKSVGVFRSHIHGRGLFCTRDIEAGEMVIEYAGELIRATLTDKRERYYDSKGIGCYMFKIDDNLVVDATMSGTAARFINHSCDPNCYSKVVDILGQKHIIIFALRRIVTGEELTYDYKFDFEDNKLPCSCGAKRCRKTMN
ncbi:unnamed protein product [Diamesa serratosioi]